MRKIVYPVVFWLFLLHIGFNCSAQIQKKVLFIGNSQTFTNNLPNLIAQMAASTGDVLDHNISAFGGMNLDQHANNTQTLDKIKQGDWEYVVIQGRSGWPALSEDFIEANVYPNYRRINDSIKKYNPCSKTVIYQTWGYKEGYSFYCPSWPQVCTYEGMDDLLQERYAIISEDIHATISPVGKVWRQFREESITDLFANDLLHPSLHGSYLAALTFYSTLFKKSPDPIDYNPGVLPSRIPIMKSIVNDLVYNNLSHWYVEEADFDYKLNQNNEVEFISKEKYADSYLWDFGDGNSSTDKNPSHNYVVSGVYNVKLTISHCGTSYNFTQTINTEVASQSHFSLRDVIRFSNPVDGVLKLKSGEESLNMELYSLQGKKVLSTQLSSNSNKNIEVSHLSKGLYLLKVETPNKGNTTYKVILQ